MTAYLEAENAYADAVMEPLRPLQEKLYAEIVSRIQETDLSVPVPHGPFLYYSRSVEGLQYAIHCRRTLDADGAGEGSPEQVLIDENVLAEGHDYCSLGAFEVSPDHRLLAWSLDTEGDEDYVLRIRDLETRRGPPGGHPRHLLRRRLGQRQPHGLLYDPRRGPPALAGLAPPPRNRPGRRRHRPPGGRRPLLLLRRADPQRRVHRHRPPVGRDLRDPGPARRRSRGHLRRPRTPAAGRRVRRRPPQRPLLHPEQRRRPELPPRRGAGGRSPPARTGGS